MSINETPSSDRIQIGLFGRRNVGKSSLFNGIVNQSLAVVSDHLGTTTDPVKKAMELLPIGPVVVWDTPGLDDEGDLGEVRVEKSKLALEKMDIALVVADAVNGAGEMELELLEQIKKEGLPYLLIFNKTDLGSCELTKQQLQMEYTIAVSASNKEDMIALRDRIAALEVQKKIDNPLLSDVVLPTQQVVLVIPIDEAAPKGRLILPQQQVLRELLEIGAIGIVVKETELQQVFCNNGLKPDLVITDSQVFDFVNASIPADVALTSFSILMARKKGFLQLAVQGVEKLKNLQDGDTVLIAEGCTHHRQCKDIGTVKLPDWITSYTKKKLNFAFCSGGEFPEELSSYSMVIHCGGCTLNDKEILRRMKLAQKAGVPFTNYGIAIACMNGILERSIACIPEVCYNH